eukprot:scaffold111521_cov21-Tisochrysis_lutea.AAC.1
MGMKFTSKLIGTLVIQPQLFIMVKVMLSVTHSTNAQEIGLVSSQYLIPVKCTCLWERTTRACISGVVERHWMHEVLPACVAASRCIIRAKLVFVMHLLATKLLRDIAESQKELCKGSLAPGNVVHVVPISAAVRAQASAPSLPRTLEWTLQG